MTLGRLIRRSYLLAAWGWPTERLSTGAMLQTWREALALLYRDHSIRALASLTGITTYQLSKEIELLGIDKRPAGDPRLQKRNPRPVGAGQGLRVRSARKANQ